MYDNVTQGPVFFSPANEAIAEAMVAAQTAMGSAQLDSKNGHFRSRYASLASCLHAALPALNGAGICLMQHPGFDPSTQVVSITTCLLHKSGQWCKSTCHLPLGGKKDGHALKSATTYLRRIGIVAVLGLPEEDDDGNATSAVARKSAPAPKASKDDVKMYCDELRRADLDPKLCAAFMSDHGRAPASELSGAQLHQRLTWLVNNASAVRSWGESR